jgi:hypothetical protein
MTRIEIMLLIAQLSDKQIEDAIRQLKILAAEPQSAFCLPSADR